MTREEAKELLPVIKAYAEGKTVQIKNKIGIWADLYEPNWDSSPDKYRIKLEPKYYDISIEHINNLKETKKN